MASSDCPECGMRRGDIFSPCPECGYFPPGQLQPGTTEAPGIRKPAVICPECSASSPLGESRCRSCGYPFSTGVVPIVERLKRLFMPRCPECGTSHPGKTKACPSCGCDLKAGVLDPGPKIAAIRKVAVAHKKRLISVAVVIILGGLSYYAYRSGLVYRVTSFFSSGSTGQAVNGGQSSSQTNTAPQVSSTVLIEADYETAVAFFKTKQYDLSLSQVRNVLAADSAHWKAWALLGNCYYQNGDKEAALAAYKQSLGINPDNPALKSWMERISPTKASAKRKVRRK